MEHSLNTVTADKVPPLLEDSIRAKKVMFLRASPGVGKSDIVRQVAKKLRLKVIDVRLAYVDPTELNGFPSVNQETKRGEYLTMDIFPLAGDPLPPILDAQGKEQYVKDGKICDPMEDGAELLTYSGWCLFFDELPQAMPATQAACFKVMLDRKVGEKNLHPRVAMVAAGNLDSDNALVEEVSTPMKSRLVHLKMTVFPKAFIEWAADNGIEPIVTSFIAFKPDNLHMFDPESDEDTFRCPRTYEFLSDFIKVWGMPVPPEKYPLIAGTIGEGGATDFIAYLKMYQDLPTFDQILANGKTMNLPKEKGTMFATTAMITANIDESNAAQLMGYVNRLDVEFAMIILFQATKKNPRLLMITEVRDWFDKNGTELL